MAEALTALQQQLENERVRRLRIRQRIRALTSRARLARRLFANPDKTLTADGLAFFQIVADMAGMGNLSMAASERDETWRAAQRALALKIMDLIHIDEPYLARLTRQTDGDSSDE